MKPNPIHRIFVVTLAALQLSGTLIRANPPPPSENCRRFFQQLEDGNRQVVVVYGTSLTEAGAWTIAMRKWFEKEYPGLVTFINSGGSGQNSNWGVESLAQKVLAHRPNLVLIEFSYNDAHEKFRLSTDQAERNLKIIVEQIAEQSSDTAVILQIMNLPWDAPNGNRSASVRPQLEEFSEVYRRSARLFNLPLLDHSTAWRELKEKQPEQFQAMIPDGSHPTPVASRAVTWPAIQAFLERSRKGAE